ncbi:hypothetical protein CPG38_08215 [Malaciobacter marinus]|uniref:ABC transporter substrate-binding protein n=1 Tax=Malaciobacter marinus TaxID=505249 RepID=UPI000C06809A|nr:ABC transporter substrate-binding protein [Malaciobacter marinus]PHO12321.1 hypothetical protein CPG38_08215 [Malaciobacter marinus]
MRIVLILVIFCFYGFANIINCSEYKKSVNNIIGQSPSVNIFLYSLYETKFPEKISKKDKRFSKIPSVEVLAKRNIELVLLYNSQGNFENLAQKLEKVNIDTCYLNLHSIYNYIDAYKSVGEIIRKQKRAEEISLYIQKELKILKRITKNIKDVQTIYYAKGDKGLVSSCDKSAHTEVFELIKAKNVVKCGALEKKRVTLSLENLLLLNPEVIVTDNKKFYKNIFINRKYSFLQAVKNKKVYLVPKKPLNYIDSPPSFFKILGSYWLGKKVYKKEFEKIDFKKKKKEFEKILLNKE